MELYESLIEKQGNTSRNEQFLETIQDQALLNFELGLRDDVKLVLRSQDHKNIQTYKKLSMQQARKRTYSTSE